MKPLLLLVPLFTLAATADADDRNGNRFQFGNSAFQSQFGPPGFPGNPRFGQPGFGNGGGFSLPLSGAEQVRTANVPGPSGTCEPGGTPACVTIVIGPLVTGGYGTAEFTLSPDRSALQYRVTASGTGTPLFMGHIHLGPRGANGPVMFWLFGDQGNAPFPLPRNDGAWTGQISGTLTAADLTTQPSLGIASFEDAVANILRGNAYVNFHTVANPAGELRGQID